MCESTVRMKQKQQKNYERIFLWITTQINIKWMWWEQALKMRANVIQAFLFKQTSSPLCFYIIYYDNYHSRKQTGKNMKITFCHKRVENCCLNVCRERKRKRERESRPVKGEIFFWIQKNSQINVDGEHRELNENLRLSTYTQFATGCWLVAHAHRHTYHSKYRSEKRAT